MTPTRVDRSALATLAVTALATATRGARDGPAAPCTSRLLAGSSHADVGTAWSAVNVPG